MRKMCRESKRVITSLNMTAEATVLWKCMNSFTMKCMSSFTMKTPFVYTVAAQHI